ncbi:MAG: YDG domain-containing protein, partial [Methylotenera sp.]|nr:YDG domain-containing protein [Methylotenera sp.]
MNKVYRLIWSEIVSAWVVVAEHVKARGKRASSKMGHVHGGGAMAVFALAGGIALSVNLAYAAPPAANQLPTGGQIVGGAAAGNIAASGNTMTVTQNNQRMIANWQSFSVGKDATVQFNQPSASSIALNRVVGQDPSQIMGRLNANGQVMLINPSGIVFGHGSQVNVGGLVASTLAISDANFNAGKYSLAQGATPAGSISNAGTITVPAGGVVALVAPSVENTGAIYTPQGSTALAAGTSVDLDFGGDGLITVRVNQSTLDALAKNGGLIQADDGYVILTAGSAKQILAGAVNNSGIIRAQGITRQGGRIVLDGGTVTNTGTLDVSSQHHAGGQIQVSGNTVNLGGTLKASGTTGGSVQVESLDQQIVTAQILAQGNSGAGGSINLASMSKIIIDFPAGEAKGRLDASGATDGGSIHLSGLSLQFTNALLSVAGEAGAGGDIALDATGGINVADSTLDASGETKGGNIQLAAGATPNPNTPAPFPTDIPTNIALTGYTMLRVNSRRGQGGNLDLEAIGGNLNLEADTDLEANGETGGSLTLTGYVVGTGGTLQANGATNGMGGMGGTIQVNASQALIDTGNMQATGDTGGHIQLNVHNLIEAGQLDASGMTQGGSIVINASGSVEQMYAASLKADGGVNGGSIRITAAGKAYLSGSESANGAAGLGGSIALTAPDLSLVGARVHADGALGGGLIRVGGGWQGGDADLTNALTTDVNTSSLLTANATQQGHGGTVVLWSENHTTFAGDIEAKGGAAGGNGGQVEISSHDTLGFAGKVTTAAPNGANGSLLLDPRNLNIETTVTAAITKLELTYANPKSNDYFGNQVKVLANGNIVVANYLDDSVAPDSGAVRLYKQDGTLLSTLTGSATNDYVGMSGIIALTNGNFVVGSYIWGGNKGASTWVNGTTGLTGMVSAANSLVGSTANDRVGLSGIALANGNYVLNTQAWASYRGAVTWGSGTVGVKGTIDSTNSLVGSSTYDSIGNYGVVALSNGNYVVKSTAWGASSNDTNTGKGAVTWGNGASGVKGYVSSTNSVVGSVNGDLVGDGVFNELSNGNYVFSSFRWNSRRGAVTWGSGTSGAVGEVGASNSLVGVNVNDYVGQRVTSLSNGNYVVTSIMVNYLGASTWANGATGITGSVTSTNSLMGTSTSDYVGSTVTALSNGNYVIGSSSWSGYKGAATWVNGTVGITGAISSANSLIGSAASDYVGYNVIALTNGHYVTSSQYWSGNKGAVTWGNGTSGVTGVVSSSNSLVGDVTNANAGLYLKALTNGNYVAATLGYGTGTTMQYGKGAVTWGNGATGITGTVSSANSLVGASAGDRIGGMEDSNGLVALTNGNYVVVSTRYGSNGNATGPGAVTWGNGATGTTGIVSSTNSLVGSGSNDRVGYMGITALTNGNYVVVSPFWGSSQGAVTWGSGTSGVTGIVSASNSLVGSANEMLTWTETGAVPVYALANGNYVVVSPKWGGNGTIRQTKGAVTWGDGAIGVKGTIDATNSLVGSAYGDRLGDREGSQNEPIVALANSDFFVKSGNYNVNQGAITWMSGVAATVGTVNTTNSLVGSASDRMGDQWSDKVFAIGNSLLVANDVADNVQYNSGRVVILSGPSSFTNPMTYGTNSGADNTITASGIVSLLNAGTNVTLQASNDLTLNSAISANNTSGNGGALNLAAGRSVLLNANIVTDNGDLNIIANDTAAHGVVNADRQAGSAVVTMGAGTSINAGTGAVNIQLLNGAGNTNNTSGEITLRDITAGNISVVNSGGTGGVTLAAGALTASGTGNALVLSGKTFTNSSSSAAAALAAANGRWLVYTDGPGSVTKNGLTSAFRHYSASYGTYAPASVTETGKGFIYASAAGALSVATTLASGTASSSYGDTPTASYGYTLTGFADSEDSASNIGISGTATYNGPTATSAAGSYTVSYQNGLSNTAGYTFSSGTGLAYTVNKRVVTLTGSRAYDGAATAAGSILSASNIVGSDALSFSGSATLASKNAGSQNITSISGLTLGGTSSGNYTLTGATGSVTVSKKAVTLTGTGIDRTYNGGLTYTTTAGDLTTLSEQLGVSGDTVTAATQAYTDKNAGGSKTVTIGSATISDGNSGNNYTITYANGNTGIIRKKAVTLTGAAATKTYDGLTSYTTTASDLTALSGQLGVSGDTVTAATQAYTNKNAGTGKAVSVSGATINDGNSGNNYTITYANGNSGVINKKAVTLTAQAATKTYDGALTYTTTAGDLTALSSQLGVSGDTVTAATQAYADKNAGTGKTVTVSAATVNDGNSGNNYTITYANATSGVINKKAVTLTALATTKTYDGGLTYTNTAGDLTSLSGQLGVSGDTVTAATQAYSDKNAGTGKTVTLSAATVSDGNSGNNYTITYANGASGTISKKAVTLTGVAATKTYDGDLTYTTTAGDLTTLSGQLGVSGDTVTAVTQAYTNKNAGTGKAVSVSSATINDGNSGNNYTITYANGASGVINKKAVTLTAQAATKTYDGGLTYTTTAGDLTALSGQLGVSGDTVTAATQAYTDKNAGTGKTVTVSGATISDGNSGNNYTVTYANGASGVINQLAVTLTGSRDYDGTATAAGGIISAANKVSGDTLSFTGNATLASKNAGVQNITDTSVLTLSGTDAGNYTLTGASGNVTVNKKAVTLTGVAATKTYDGDLTYTTTAGDLTTLSGQLGVSGDTVTAATQAYTNKNAGTGKAVSVSGATISDGNGGNNYTITYANGSGGEISKKAVTLTALAASKTYDGLTSYTNTASDLTALSGQLGVSGDTVTAATQAYSDKNASTGKTVTLSGATISDGNSGNNYTVTYATNNSGEISKKALSVSGITASNKEYDGTTAATLSVGSAVFGGKVTGDDLSIDTGVLSGSFADANAGTSKAVNLTGATLSGTDAGNYTLSGVGGVTADITKKALTVTATDAARTYDGTNWTGGNGVSYSGFIAGEDDTALGGTLAYGGTAQSSRNAGTYTLSASGLTSGNYNISYVGGNLVTSKKAVTLTALAASKTYDGLTSYTNTASDLTALSGQLGVSGDTITAATQAYSDKNAGTGKTVTLSGATISDGNSGNNYTITYANGSSGEISKKALTVSGITASNKEYDGTTTASLSVGSAVFGGKVTGDDLSIDTGVLSGSFADANAGTSKAVNLTGATLSGTDAGNYT